MTGICGIAVIMTAVVGTALSTDVVASASATAGLTATTHLDSPLVSAAMAAGSAAASAYQLPSRRLSITSITPASGPTTGDTTVTITGTDLLRVSEVRFGATTAAGFTVTSASTITARTKAHAGRNSQDIGRWPLRRDGHLQGELRLRDHGVDRHHVHADQWLDCWRDDGDHHRDRPDRR